MTSAVCLRRLRRELLALKREPDETVRVATEADSLLVWHFVLSGVEDSPFEGGQYWGRINFPETYPIQPPSVYFFTPNGRFETGKRLCLHGISDYHGEDWNPSTTINGLLQSIRHSMQDDGIGIGSINESIGRCRELSERSSNYNRRDAKFRLLFHDDDSDSDDDDDFDDRRRRRRRLAVMNTDPGTAAALPPPFVAVAAPSAPVLFDAADIATMKDTELKDLISMAGLSSMDCSGRAALRERAGLAVLALRGEATDPALQSGQAGFGGAGAVARHEPAKDLAAWWTPPKPEPAGPTGDAPGMIVDSLWDVDRIMQSATDGDIKALAEEVRRTPHAVHAIRRDGKTPAIIAALNKHVAALVFLVERGASFKHHGAEPEFNGHHVSSLQGCEVGLNRLVELSMMVGTNVFLERRAIIEQIHTMLVGPDEDMGTDLRSVIADTCFPRSRDAPTRQSPAKSSGEPVVRIAYLIAEMRMPLCSLHERLQRLRIIIDIMLAADEEIKTFIDLDGMVFLEELVNECIDQTAVLIENPGASETDEGMLASGLYFVSRVVLFVCLYATGERRDGNPGRRKQCISQRVCETVMRTLVCRLLLGTAGALETPEFLPAAPANKTVSFACQALTELSFDVDTAEHFDPAEAKMLVEALCNSYAHDQACAEMLSWWTSNMIGHDVFAELPEKATWAAKVADEMMQRHHALERAKNLLDITVNNNGRANIQRAACNGDTKLLLQAIAADPTGIHRPDNSTGQMPLMAAANTGNKSVCDALIVLIERGSALKYHAPGPNRGRHHVDKFVQHADIVESLANLAEVGYDDEAVKRVCPGGHLLKPFFTEADGYRCDTCSKSVPQGSKLFGSKGGCDGGYDECQQCYDVYTSSVDCRLRLREQLVDKLRALYPPPPLSAKTHQVLLASCMGCTDKKKPATGCSEDKCFMCSEPFNEIPEEDMVTLCDDCGHQHHRPCLGEWLMGNRGSCPTCDLALSVAWPARPDPPPSAMSVTAPAIRVLEDSIKSSGSAGQLSATLGARILADQILSSTRRARTVVGSAAMPLLLSTIGAYRNSPEVLYNVALVVLELAIGLKIHITVDSIRRHYLPIINAVLEACIGAESRSSLPDPMWPVVAELAVQTAAELSLGPAFPYCGPVLAELGLITVVLQTIKFSTYHASAELVRMVWILLSNTMAGGGDLAENCRAQCAGLLHSELRHRQLLPGGWLRPLANVAGTYAEIWEHTDYHRPATGGNDPMGALRIALSRLRTENNDGIDEID